MTVHNPTLSVGGTFDTPTLSGALYHQSTFNNLFIEGAVRYSRTPTRLRENQYEV